MPGLKLQPKIIQVEDTRDTSLNGRMKEEIKVNE